MSMNCRSTDSPGSQSRDLVRLFVMAVLVVVGGSAWAVDDTKCPGSSDYTSASSSSVPTVGGSGGGGAGGAGGGLGGGSGSSSNNAFQTIMENTLDCTECMEPFSMGASSMSSSNGWYYPDSMNYDDMEGTCEYSEYPPIIHSGMAIGFFEASHLVDIVRKKGCAIALDGSSINVDSGGGSSSSGSGTATGAVGELFSTLKKFGVHNSHEDAHDSTEEESFYNVHIYENFMGAEIAGSIFDSSSGESCGQEPQYTTFFSEIDDGWNNDIDNSVFTPEALLFADNITAQMACAADCLFADIQVPIDLLEWCAGCQGSMFPNSGRVPNHIGGVQAAVLLTQRVMFINARTGLYKPMHAHYGGSMMDTWHGYCQPQWSMEPVLHKSNYRYQVLYPIAQSDGVSIGGCCAPFGRTTTLFEFFKEIPYKAEDWVVGISEKRHCIYGTTF